LVVPWALRALDLRRLEAWVQPENVASQQVLRNAGFLEEGRLRSFLTIEGEAADVLVFSTIRPEQEPTTS
jgi:ribosomal-protein-alanine N-acetyltransferase